MRILALILLTLAISCGTRSHTVSPPGPPPPLKASFLSKDFPAASDLVSAVTVPLNPGWNAVAFQSQQLTALTGTVDVAGIAWWDGAQYQTQALTISNVNAGEGGRRGLWAFANAATSFTYSGQDDHRGNRLLLAPGWNLVSFTNSAPLPTSSLSAQQNGQTVPLGSVLLPSFSQIGPDNQYIVVNAQQGGVLQPGRACWIFANSAVTLSWSAPPGPSPSPGASPSPTPGPSASPAATPTPSPLAWSPVAPMAFRGTGGAAIAGRVNAAVPHPTNPNVMYLATDGARPTGPAGNPIGEIVPGLPDTGGGGVWVTSNWSSPSPTWTPLTDGAPSLSVGLNGLELAPTNSSVMYAVADSPQGCVLTSQNGFQTFQAQGQSLFAGVKFGGVTVSPTNASTAWLGVYSGSPSAPGGVYKTTDGGSTWTPSGNLGNTSRVVVDPLNPNILYAGVVGGSPGVYKSTDGGGNWTSLAANFPAGTFSSSLFINLTLAPPTATPSPGNATSTAYAVVLRPSNKPHAFFYRTTDGGGNWTQLDSTAQPPEMADNRFWHQFLTVHPQSANVVFGEGLNHFGVVTSSAGLPGAAPSPQWPWQVCWSGDDPAGMTFLSHPGQPLTLAAFGDRGIYSVTNVSLPINVHALSSSFSRRQGNLNNGLLLTITPDPTNASNLFTIAYDQLNAARAQGNVWQYMGVGGEMGRVVLDPQQPRTAYLLNSFGDVPLSETVQRSTDGGGNWTTISQSLALPSPLPGRAIQTTYSAWRAIEVDPNNSNNVLVGVTQVFQGSPQQGGSWSWTALSQPLVGDPTVQYISYLAVTPAVGNQTRTVYAATSDGQLYAAGPSTGQSWPTVGPALPAGGFITRIEYDPTNPQRLVVAAQNVTGATGRLWTSANAGQSWTDLSGNLPTGQQVYTVAVDWTGAGQPLFVGTDRGVYTTSGFGTSWTKLSQGLPNTLVSDLRVIPSGVLTAATYGRGAFQLQLPR